MKQVWLHVCLYMPCHVDVWMKRVYMRMYIIYMVHVWYNTSHCTSYGCMNEACPPHQWTHRCPIPQEECQTSGSSTCPGYWCRGQTPEHDYHLKITWPQHTNHHSHDSNFRVPVQCPVCAPAPGKVERLRTKDLFPLTFMSALLVAMASVSPATGRTHITYHVQVSSYSLIGANLCMLVYRGSVPSSHNRWSMGLWGRSYYGACVQCWSLRTRTSETIRATVTQSAPMRCSSCSVVPWSLMAT